MSTDKKQALQEHIRALRRVLVVSVAAVAVLFLLLFYLCCDPLVDFVLQPLRTRGIDVIATAVSEALMLQFKVCLIAAVVAGMPIIIQQIFQIIQRVNANGTTVFLVEQNANQALRIAHRGYVMENGRIVTSNSAENLLKSEDVRSAYLGM